MYKIEWSEKMEKLIGPYHDFVVEILNFVNEEPRFLVEQETDIAILVKKMKEMKEDENCTYKFMDIATGTNLKKYICDLKYEGIDLLKKYKEFIANYQKFINRDWQDNTQYSEGLTKAFGYFYSDLIHGKIFNEIAVSEIDAIRDFRHHLTLESTCPYCDYHEMEFDSASIDHFIPKSKYPLVSIYPKNLIVSCNTCNERIKQGKLYLPIMHPYFDNLDDYFNFSYKNESIKIEFRDDISKKDKEKVENFLKLFNIEERYNKKCKRKLNNLKKEIQRCVIKQIKGFENITNKEIEYKIKEEIHDKYIIIFNNKNKDSLTKLKLDYLLQMNEEDLSEMCNYIAQENGNSVLENVCDYSFI